MKILPDFCIELIFQQAGIIAVTDKEGRYVFVNDRWVKDTGIPKEKALGKFNHELFEGGQAITAIKTKKAIVGHPLTKTLEDGRLLPGVISYMPIFHNSEAVGCFISSAFLNREQMNEFISKIMQVKEENEFLRVQLRKRSGRRYAVSV